MKTPKQRKHSATKAEIEVAKDLGGRKTFLSGAGMDKADVVVGSKFATIDGRLQELPGLTFRIEVKTTAADSFTFKIQDWIDVVASADKAGQIPVFVIKTSIDALARSYAVVPYALISEKLGAIPISSGDELKKSTKIGPTSLSEYWCLNQLRRVTLSERKKHDVVIMEYARFVEWFGSIARELK